MGLIATRSLDTELPGINELESSAPRRASATASIAYDALQKLRAGPAAMPRRAGAFDEHGDDLGYALLLKRYVRRSAQGDARADHQGAPWDTMPDVPPLFWSLPHHGGAAASSSSLLFALAFFVPSRAPARRATAGCCGSRCAALPLPWIAAELGWIVAEYGRQPWVIEGVLPTALAPSSGLGAGTVLLTIVGFVVLYTVLLVDRWSC